MQTEVYDERELNSQTLEPEKDEEALAIISELGLAGQTSDENQTKRICYPQPTKDQAFVIMALFPKRTAIKDYSAGAIPLRVLKEMRSYLIENPTHQLFICHQAPAVVKDPVLLAYPGEFPHNNPDYIELVRCRMIARWGDTLESWDNLMETAMRGYRESVKSALHKVIAQAETCLASLAGGMSIKTPSSPSTIPQLFSLPD